MWLTVRARGRTRPASLLILTVIVVLAIIPMSSSNQYTLTLACVYAIAAVGLDVLSGFVGLASVGQFAFAGVGGYFALIMASRYGLGLALSSLVAILAATVVALLVGLVLVRLNHFGFAIATFFFAGVVQTALSGKIFASFTNSEAGLLAPDNVSTTGLEFAAVIALVIVTMLAHNLVDSRSGRALRQIKTNESVASSLGVPVYWHKVAAFAGAGLCAGVSGCLFALAVGSVVPESFAPTQSIDIYAMATVGGLGTIAGPVLGAIFFEYIQQGFQFSGASDAILFAVALLVVLVLAPQGLFGILEYLTGLLASPARRLAAARLGLLRPKPPADEAPGAQVPAALDTRPAAVSDLVVDSLTVNYGGITAIADLNCTVDAGSIHAVVGPNGAGKTTLMNCISGFQRPTAGTVRYNGLRLDRSSPAAVRRQGLARAFQNRSLVPELTVLENVALGCYTSVRWSAARDLVGPWLTRRMRRRETALAQDALDAVSFPVDRRQVPAWELSLGEQKLVDIARALAGRAEVLVLDEPTAGLNHDEMDALGEVLQELRNRSAVTVVLVAHHVAFVSRVADAVTVLDGGRCIASGPPQSVFTDPEVVVAFLGEEIVSDVAPDGRQP